MIVSWFSCGNNSAVASKLVIVENKEPVVVARCVVDNEHPDNDRFHDDCERWYGQAILRLRSSEFADCWEVWEKRRYISGIKGAPCTAEMKKVPRWDFEGRELPKAQVFGFSNELVERRRADRFRAQNPEIKLLTPLIDAGLDKAMCAEIIEAAGIAQPVMYKIGFKNNNCIGCAKATSIVYWARTRHHFPIEFYRMAVLSREIGCRLTRLKGKRIFLDEIPDDFDWQKLDRSTTECSLLCAGS